MEEMRAVDALAALAQATRLRLYRLLVQAGPLGLAAGSIALTLGVPAPTLSFHLKGLVQAGLVRVERRGRQMIYAADIGAMRALVDFLTDDCCQGHPELCRGGAEEDALDGSKALQRSVPLHR